MMATRAVVFHRQQICPVMSLQRTDGDTMRENLNVSTRRHRKIPRLRVSTLPGIATMTPHAQIALPPLPDVERHPLNRRHFVVLMPSRLDAVEGQTVRRPTIAAHRPENSHQPFSFFPCPPDLS